MSRSINPERLPFRAHMTRVLVHGTSANVEFIPVSSNPAIPTIRNANPRGIGRVIESHANSRMITNSHAGGRAAIRTVTTYAVADNGAYYSLFRDLTDAVVAAVGRCRDFHICIHDHIVRFAKLSFGGGAPIAAVASFAVPCNGRER
jgi:hypothetical protein